MMAELRIRCARWWPLSSDTAARRRGLRGARGFTLIELLVVISMISILAAMGVVQYRNSVQRTKEATLKKDLFEMRDVIDQYYADKGKYPSSLDALVSDGYMRKIPVDPITNSTDTLGDRSGRSRSRQSVGRAGHLRRQERRPGHVARRHRLRRVLDGQFEIYLAPAAAFRLKPEATPPEKNATRSQKNCAVGRSAFARGFRLQSEGCRRRCEQQKGTLPKQRPFFSRRPTLRSASAPTVSVSDDDADRSVALRTAGLRHRDRHQSGADAGVGRRLTVARRADLGRVGARTELPEVADDGRGVARDRAP